MSSNVAGPLQSFHHKIFWNIQKHNQDIGIPVSIKITCNKSISKYKVLTSTTTSFPTTDEMFALFFLCLAVSTLKAFA